MTANPGRVGTSCHFAKIARVKLSAHLQFVAASHVPSNQVLDRPEYSQQPDFVIQVTQR